MDFLSTFEETTTKYDGRLQAFHGLCPLSVILVGAIQITWVFNAPESMSNFFNKEAAICDAAEIHQQLGHGQWVIHPYMFIICKL